MKTRRQISATLRAVRHAAGLAVVLGAATSVQAQTPLFQWKFDETGSIAPSTLPGGGVGDLNLINGAGVAADLHTSAGFAPGAAGSAFDGTSSGGHGSQSPAAGTVGTSGTFGNTILDTDSSFTVTGWLRSPTAVNGSAKVFIFGADTITGDGSGNSTAIAFNSSGQMTFDARNSSLGGGTVLSAGTFLSVDTWTFFAISYDGGTADNTLFYRGTEITASGLHTTGHISAQPIVDFNGASSLSKVFIGNRQDRNRPFDGYIDDIRFYSNVLDATQIEGVRLSAVPEPSTGALLALVGVGFFARRVKRFASARG